MQNREDKIADKGASMEEPFIIHELKERINIEQKSRLFKKMVDTTKDIALEKIEENHLQREKQITDTVNQVETALKTGDSEIIKEVLRKYSGV